jgi:hypothetical protein
MRPFNMHKRIQTLLVAFLSVLFPLASLAQPEIDLPLTEVKWVGTSHSFGQHEEGEILEYTYLFTNSGTNPLKIYQVMPACGCTTPEYTKEEVMPGDKGFVKVIFNSQGRLGYQNKMVTVLMNTDPKNTVLTFTADIYAGPPPGPGDGIDGGLNPTGGNDAGHQNEGNQATEFQPPVAGGIYFPQPKFDFGKVEEGDTVVHEYVFMNTGTKPITLQHVKASCGCTTPEWPKEPIPRGGKGTIKVSFDTHGKGGTQEKTINVISDAEPQNVTLHLTGAVNVGNKGRLQLAEVIWKIPVKSKGKKVVKTIEVTNMGEAPLTIGSYQSTCNCVTAQLPTGAIPVGGKAQVVLTRSLKDCTCNPNEAVIFNTDGYPAEAGVTIVTGQ